MSMLLLVIYRFINAVLVDLQVYQRYASRLRGLLHHILVSARRFEILDLCQKQLEALYFPAMHLQVFQHC